MKNLILFFTILFSLVLFGQTTDQSQIVKDTKVILQNMQTKNYDGIIDLTYPAIFEKVDRNSLKKAFKSLLEGNDEFGMELLDLDKTKFVVSKVYETKEKTKYAFVTYPLKMKMIFPKKKFDESTKKLMENMMEAQGMKARFLNENMIEVSKLSLTIALRDKITKNSWKYANYDKTNPLFVSVMPVEVVKKANNYYSDLLIKDKEHAN